QLSVASPPLFPYTTLFRPGVSCARTSSTGANAVTTRETGDTDFCAAGLGTRDSGLGVHWACIDKESLPTGIDRSSAGHSSIAIRSEEHTSELQSRENLVCR